MPVRNFVKWRNVETAFPISAESKTDGLASQTDSIRIPHSAIGDPH